MVGVGRGLSLPSGLSCTSQHPRSPIDQMAEDKDEFTFSPERSPASN